MHEVCGSPSTLSPPFPSTSSSSHSSFISCTSSCTSSTTLRAVASLCTPPKNGVDSLDDSYLLTGYEPNAYDLKETYVDSYAESLTNPQFSKQGFLEDVEYDDTALEDMLPEAHRVHVYHSQREGLSVGQSSSSMSERTGRPVGVKLLNLSKKNFIALKQKNFNDEINNFFMNGCCSKIRNYVKLIIKVSMKWKN